jgi:hypothetical protein
MQYPMDDLRMQTISMLHPHHFLPDKIIFVTEMFTKMKSSCGLGKTNSTSSGL